MVKSVIDDITTFYPNAAYQVKTDGSNTNTRKYYSFNGAVVAMRENGVVSWLLQDQVNSTTVTANADGSFQSEVRYSAYGEMRYAFGTTVTDKLYTGQQQETEIGLSYYIARFYDPVIAHFVQPDSIIPQAGSTLGYDRFGYVNGNPINFNDPSGHAQVCADGDFGGGCGSESTAATYLGAISAWFDNVTVGFQAKWTTQQTKTLLHGLLAAASLHGGAEEFAKDVGKFSVAPTKNPKFLGMVIPFKSPVMLLNTESFSVGTVLHETGHVFDFNGKKNKSDSFVSFFSPGVSCKSAILGCLNQNPHTSSNSNNLYSLVNTLVSGEPNYGYKPDYLGTTYYGEASTIDDWADTYMVMGLDLAGFKLSPEHKRIWSERVMLVQMFINQ